MKYFSPTIALFSVFSILVACTASMDVQTYQECVDAGYDVTSSAPVICTTPDGRVFRAEISTTESDVRLSTPQENVEVSGSLRIAGEAKGTWFFEGVLPVTVVDNEGDILLEESLQADGEWMTEDYVPFDETFEISVEQKTDAELVIHKSNPSGLPEHADEVRVPIVLVPSNNESRVNIENEFMNKIVYTSGQESDDLRADCEARGGTFNECGSPCAPDAEACIQVCTTVCTLSSTSSSSLPETWEEYSSEEVGFSMRVPAALSIQDTVGGPSVTTGKQLTLWGPTQTANTELFDGISISVLRGTYEQTLQAHVSSAIEDIEPVGEITQPVRTVDFAGRQSLTFTADTLGVHTHYYVPLEQNAYLHVVTSNPDPTNQGYERQVQQILDSFEVLQ